MNAITYNNVSFPIFEIMFSQQAVSENESVTLKQAKTPIWALEIVFKWAMKFGFDLGIRFTYWGQSSET